MHTTQQTEGPDMARQSAAMKLALLKKILETDDIERLERAIALFSPQEYDSIPIGIFSNDIFSLNECVVKFLHENRSWSFTKIAQVTAKSPKTVWQTYQNAKKKSGDAILILGENKACIPISAFSDEKMSTLEIVVAYLKDEEHMDFKAIAASLHRDYQTIWTTYKRAKAR